MKTFLFTSSFVVVSASNKNDPQKESKASSLKKDLFSNVFTLFKRLKKGFTKSLHWRKAKTLNCRFEIDKRKVEFGI